MTDVVQLGGTHTQLALPKLLFDIALDDVLWMILEKEPRFCRTTGAPFVTQEEVNECYTTPQEVRVYRAMDNRTLHMLQQSVQRLWGGMVQKDGDGYVVTGCPIGFFDYNQWCHIVPR